MTLVNPTVPQAGDTAEATDISVPVGQLATTINGNLDDTNVASLSGTKLIAGTTPADAMTDSANPELRMSETLSNFIASGMVWSTTTGLGGSMTAGVAYVNGKRLSVPAIASHTFTASKDTYIFVDDGGAISYLEVANNAAQPSTPSNNATVAKVVSGASSISSVIAMPSAPVTAPKIDFATLTFGNFSTSEVDTGFTWIDGKKIYKKTISCGAMPGTATTYSVNHLITGLTSVIEYRGIGMNTSGLQFIDFQGGNLVNVYIDATKINLTTTSTRSAFTLSYVTIWYTK